MSRYIVEVDPDSLEDNWIVVREGTGIVEARYNHLGYAYKCADELNRRELNHKTWFDHY